MGLFLKKGREVRAGQKLGEGDEAIGVLEEQ